MTARPMTEGYQQLEGQNLNMGKPTTKVSNCLIVRHFYERIRTTEIPNNW